MGDTVEPKVPAAKILKVRFKMNEDGLFGALVVMVHPSGDIATSTFVLINDEQTYETVSAEDGWQKFFAVINELSSQQTQEGVADIAAQVCESIKGYQVNDDILAEDIGAVDSSLREILAKALKVECESCDIAIEEANDVTAVIPQESVSGDDRPEIEKTANLVLDATLVISPVRGKYIQDIIPGDLMRVVLLKKDEVTKKVARALKAVNDEGDYLPVKGRVKQKMPNEKGGATIYCVIAKNILAKIVEEENIKAELFLSDVIAEAKRPVIPKMIIYAGATAVLIILISLVLLLLL